MLDSRVPPQAVATAAVRIARRLAVRGCDIRRWSVAGTGTIYIAASILRVRFAVRVSDHHGRRHAGNYYVVRVDDPSRSTPVPLSVYLDRLARSRFDTPDDLPAT